MNITICGGGNLGHVCAGFFAAQDGVAVRVLTRRPECWSGSIVVTDSNGQCFVGNLDLVTDDTALAVKDADIVLLCLPGFSIAEELKRIKPFLDVSTAVGSVVSSTGFFFCAFDILPHEQPLFGFQRVPFICRINEYGHSADLLGYKSSLSVAIEQSGDREVLRLSLESLCKCPVRLLESHYEASLTNSNPLLHTSRLFSMWRDFKPGMIFSRIPMFYSEWTNESSELLIAMDNEFQDLLCALGVRRGAIPTILDYYESRDAASLTAKLCSIDAFKGLPAPMKEVEGGFVPDFESRYFTEDFPYGLKFIHDLAHDRGVASPNIDRVFEWGDECENGK